MVPMGDFTKNSTGRMGRLTESERPTVPTLYALGGLIDIPLCRESHSRELHLFSGGDLPALTPHSIISGIPEF